jgi:molybdate transport system substrate-binding protein
MSVIWLTAAVCALTAVLSGCQNQANADGQTLTVFAASSLTDAFSEIGEAFEAANPGVRVVVNFSSSHSLRTQIEEGARADVFASANQQQMDALTTAGLVEALQAEDFVLNRLVVIVPADNPAALTSPEGMAAAGIKVVLAAEAVPVGEYAREAIEKMTDAYGLGFSSRVWANVVSFEDNVRQVAAKVQLGEADAGIVYLSDAAGVPDLAVIEIPEAWNVTARYPIAPLAGSEQVALARAFIEYVRSAEGMAILQKCGFTPVE